MTEIQNDTISRIERWPSPGDLRFRQEP